MRNNRPELLGDVIARVMDTLNTRRQEMCDFFDDFDEFLEDGFDDCDFDDDIEDSMDADPEDGKSDELSWDEAYWIGTGIGWAYEEGKQKRRRRKNADPNDPSNID